MSKTPKNIVVLFRKRKITIKKLTLFFFFLLAMSCQKESVPSLVAFEVVNKSSSEITTFKILATAYRTDAYEAITDTDVQKESTKNYTVDLQKYQQAKDGSYLVVAEYKNGQKSEHSFGYFSNNTDSSPNKKYQIIVKDNTIESLQK